MLDHRRLDERDKPIGAGIASRCRARRMIGGVFRSLASPAPAPDDAGDGIAGRRRFLLGAAAGGDGADARPARHWRSLFHLPGRATYQLVRHGDVIGHETISFSQSGGILTVTIEARIRVTLALVTIYALDHHETRPGKRVPS